MGIKPGTIEKDFGWIGGTDFAGGSQESWPPGDWDMIGRPIDWKPIIGDGGSAN